MIITFKQETVDFWKEQGIEAELQFEADGFQYWKIDVPEDHALLASPEYLGLVLAEQKDYREMIRTRFKPPMFTVIVNRRVAMTPMRQENQPMAMPIARDLRLLRSIFTKPEHKQFPKYMKLKRLNQIVNAMREVRQFGVQHIAYYVSDGIVETFKLDTVASAIMPRVQLVGEDVNGETVPEDEKVQPVPATKDVQTSSPR